MALPTLPKNCWYGIQFWNPRDGTDTADDILFSRIALVPQWAALSLCLLPHQLTSAGFHAVSDHSDRQKPREVQPVGYCGMSMCRLFLRTRGGCSVPSTSSRFTSSSSGRRVHVSILLRLHDEGSEAIQPPLYVTSIGKISNTNPGAIFFF